MNQNNPKRYYFGDKKQCQEGWFVMAESGQRISVELYDFSLIKALLPANQSTIFREKKQKQKFFREINSRPHQTFFDFQSQPHSSSLLSPSSNPSSSSQPAMASRCIVSVADVYELDYTDLPTIKKRNNNMNEIKGQPDEVPLTPAASISSQHPSYTLCGSDLEVLNEDMKTLLNNKSNHERCLIP